MLPPQGGSPPFYSSKFPSSAYFFLNRICEILNPKRGETNFQSVNQKQSREREIERERERERERELEREKERERERESVCYIRIH